MTIDLEFRISDAGKSEPILWIAAVGAGAGTDFTRGVAGETCSLMAHRVRETVSVDFR